VSRASLNAHLEEENSLELPQQYYGRDEIGIANKSMYGLRQAPRDWNKEHIKGLEENNLPETTTKCLHRNPESELKTAAITWVDDGLVGSKNANQLDQVINGLSTKWNITTEHDPRYFVGINIKDNHGNRIISTETYIEDCLSKYGLDKANARTTICNTVLNPSKVTGKQDTSYRNELGKLMWIATTARPDLAFYTGMLARAAGNPTEEHIKAIKAAWRYLAGTKSLKIKVGGGDTNTITTYCDASFASYADKRSVNGLITFLGDTAVAWKSKRQTATATATAYAELDAIFAAIKQTMQVRSVVDSLTGHENKEADTVFSDNQAAIRISNGDGPLTGIRHLDIKVQWIREQVCGERVVIKFIPGNDNIADMLTKPLPGHRLKKLRATALQ
jgi:hypothetical protein